MYLQQHLGFQLLAPQNLVDADHRQLDQIRRRALQRRIDRRALGERSRVGIAGVHVRDRSLAAEQRRRETTLAHLRDGLSDELLHASVQLEIRSDVLFGLLAIDAQRSRQSKWRLPVHDPEVHRLGVAPHLGSHHQWRHAEDFGGRSRVNIFAAAKCVHQNRIVRHVRQQAQLDLRIVRHHQLPAFARHKGGANLTAQRGADRNILQIRIRRRQPPRRRAGLIERGVNAAGLRIDQLGQRVDVSALELRELAILQHLARDFVFGRQAFQHICGGRDAFAFAVFHRSR